MEPARLKGTPRNSKDWSLEPRDKLRVIIGGDEWIGFEFLIPVSASWSGPVGVTTVEWLLAMTMHSPEKIGFGVEIEDEDGVCMLYLLDGESDMRLGIIGELPWPASMVLRTMWTPLIVDGLAKAEKYEIELSTVGRVIDPARVMDEVDWVDHLSEGEYDQMMKGMEETLDGPIYSVKIGLRIPKDQYGHVVKCLGGGDVGL